MKMITARRLGYSPNRALLWAGLGFVFASVASTCLAANTQVLLDGVDAGAAFRYRVAVGNCRDESCAIVVHLAKDGRDIDHKQLSWKVSAARFELTELSAGDGAGDPLNPDKSIPAWTAGEESDATTLAIRPIHLTATLRGILLDQRVGFEHVKRQHTIIAALNGKLRVLWAASDGSGPTYSTPRLSI
jgi:hypothetical protein